MSRFTHHRRLLDSRNQLTQLTAIGQDLSSGLVLVTLLLLLLVSDVCVCCMAVLGGVFGGVLADEMGIGPIYAVPKLLKRHGLTVDDIDIWELNEAFASQCLYSRDKLGIDPEKYNVNGGSIAIGHPFGMTGTRCAGHILQEGKRRGAKLGVVTMCIGGGQGAAGLIEIY